MSEYIKKVDLLNKAVEVEYLGRPRLMVSVARIGETPSIDIVRCKDCKWSDKCSRNVAMQDSYQMYETIDFCSYGCRKEGSE